MSGCADFKVVVQPSFIHMSSLGLLSEDDSEFVDKDPFGFAVAQYPKAAA